MKTAGIICGSLIIALLAIGWAFNCISSKRGWQKGLSPKMKKQNKLPFPLDTSWLEQSGAKDAWIKSYDGLKLHAYVINNHQGDWAVICHGYTANAKCMSPFGEKYAHMGYNVLLIDARAHGKSGGKFIGFGWPERRDLIDWLNYLNDNYQAGKIIIHGVSMGGATVMMTSGEEDLPDNVAVMIEDCGYISVLGEFRYLIKNMYHLPVFPILPVTSLFYRLHNGFSFYRQGFADRQLAKAHIPMLFIHGDADKFVPCSMMEQAYDAAACPKDKLLIKGAGHGKSCIIAPESYWQKIRSFLDKYMQNN